jgi:hypothetical protein
MFDPIVQFIIIVAVLIYGVSKINYHIDDQYLRIRLGQMTFRRFAIKDIRDARVWYSHWAESWTNTIYPPAVSKRSVTIYRRTGIFKKVVISPDDPAGFVERIKRHPRFVPGGI